MIQPNTCIYTHIERESGNNCLNLSSILVLNGSSSIFPVSVSTTTVGKCWTPLLPTKLLQIIFVRSAISAPGELPKLGGLGYSNDTQICGVKLPVGSIHSPDRSWWKNRRSNFHRPRDADVPNFYGKSMKIPSPPRNNGGCRGITHLGPWNGAI